MSSTRPAADLSHDRPEPPGVTHEPSDERVTPEATEVASSLEQYAVHLRETTASLFMFACMDASFKSRDPNAYKLFRDRLLADCGNPSDPIEVMIVEQLALAHFSLGLLQCRATNASQIEATGVYSSAAARLMAEFRRSALALQAYRAASRQLANDPTKDLVIPVEEAGLSEAVPGKKCIADEQHAVTEIPDAGETIIPYPGPTDRGDQPAESPEVARVHARRTRTGSRRPSGESAVGAVHRAANA